MKTKWYILAYSSAVALTAISYWPARNFLIMQEPVDMIRISNLTVNYILMFCLAGGTSPYIMHRFFPRAPKWTSIALTCIIVVVLLQFMKLLGYQVRF